MDKIIAHYKALLDELLAAPKLAFDDTLKVRLPQSGGVYHVGELTSDGQRSIYVGQSNNLKRRIYKRHLKGLSKPTTLRRKIIASGEFSDQVAITEFMTSKCFVQFTEIDESRERTFFEHFVIAVLRPIYND